MAMHWSDMKGSGRFGNPEEALDCKFKVALAEEASGGDLCVEGREVAEEVLQTALGGVRKEDICVNKAQRAGSCDARLGSTARTRNRMVGIYRYREALQEPSQRVELRLQCSRELTAKRPKSLDSQGARVIYAVYDGPVSGFAVQYLHNFADSIAISTQMRP